MKTNTDNKSVVDELYRRTRIAVSENDPALVMLALANMILESQSDLAAERVSAISAGFEHTAEKTANSIVESLNKAFGILQRQLNEIEAAKKSISLPDLLEEKYSKSEAKTPDDDFKAKFQKTAITAGTFALGATFAFLISGFMWVFFR